MFPCSCPTILAETSEEAPAPMSILHPSSSPQDCSWPLSPLLSSCLFCAGCTHPSPVKFYILVLSPHLAPSVHLCSVVGSRVCRAVLFSRGVPGLPHSPWFCSFCSRRVRILAAPWVSTLAQGGSHRAGPPDCWCVSLSLQALPAASPACSSPGGVCPPNPVNWSSLLSCFPHAAQPTLGTGTCSPAAPALPQNTEPCSQPLSLCLPCGPCPLPLPVFSGGLAQFVLSLKL